MDTLGNVTQLVYWYTMNITPYVSLIIGSMYTMAGIVHSFKRDGGKYSIAGFPPDRFDDYTHATLMFWSGFEGGPQLVRGPLMVLSVFLFPQYSIPLLILDGTEGTVITLICDQGNWLPWAVVKPLPSPPRGPGAPGGKMIVVKSLFFLSCGLMWWLAGNPVLEPLPYWASLIPLFQLPIATWFMWTRKIPENAMKLINRYYEVHTYEKLSKNE